MTLRLAFIGLRHGHIFDLYKRANESKDIEIVAACEEDAATRDKVSADGVVKVTHSDYGKMLDEVTCDAVAVGDYYAARGGRILEALKRGKHAITDKPPCIRLDELDRIESLLKEKKLKLGCMFDVRDSGPFIGMRDLLRQGLVGEVHAIVVSGQHPLIRKTRPSWYFENGKHGGTINDIGIHVFDMVPWMTGLEFTSVTAARAWNAFAEGTPMKDAGQFMTTLNNGAGVMAEVSYFMPDSMGYTIPLYWRTTVFGRKGVLEASYTTDRIRVGLDGMKEEEMRPVPKPNPGGYLRAFLDDIRGEAKPDAVTTGSVLRAARNALTVQNAADEGRRDVALSGAKRG